MCSDGVSALGAFPDRHERGFCAPHGVAACPLVAALYRWRYGHTLSHRHVAAAAHIPSRSSATFGRGGDFILIFGAHISAPSVAVLVVSGKRRFADVHEPPHFLIRQPTARRHLHNAPLMCFRMAHHETRDVVPAAVDD